jgi:hypothetical protein
MFRIARHFLLVGFGFAAFAGQAHAQFNNPFKTPKIETPKFQAPKLPPVHLPPVHLPSPPPVKLPPVHVPQVKLPPVHVPPVHLPPVPDVKVPTVKLPPVKLPPVKVPPLITLKPPQPTVFTDPPSTPSIGKKPNGGTQVGPQLGNSTPGIVIPPTQKPPVKPPVPGPGTKPNTNVTVVVVPTGLLGGFNRPNGGGRPPVVVNPQPLVVPQPVVVNPEPVVVPQPVVTPEPVQTAGGTETPAAAANANALRVKERFLDGAAAQAGIQLGDILIAAGGKRLKTVEDLEAVSAMKVKLDVVYLDSTNNKLATCQLTGDGASFGVAVDPVAIDLEEEQPAETEQAIPEGTPTALQITEVTPRGPAARAGLQVGDVIVAIGGKRVETIEALNAALLRGIEVEVLFVNPEDGKADTRKLKVTADVGLAVKRIAVAEK